MTGRLDREVERAAAKASRERRARTVRPGWWVYSPAFVGWSWRQVTKVSLFGDHERLQVRLDLVDLAGKTSYVKTSANAPAWCVSPSVAERVGLVAGERRR
ncbi:hypothetical protein Ae717Ps2_0371 [Pseudonocardia sp. Ae717_Ps2]|uniref:hypothetical protein n=1 Tax=unclassified Pseudonocardia TaxID=2619320 RepID=UPI00094AB95A|nr:MULTISPECIES: hypothetical protein [unclassified Pseudonocardia]OLM12108.1 hypothetical protein Ae505Ps2_2235 [Pseudonocardia sp. Ae505_Ps2]OLM29478.1 hypothetical protein Ae717Ps2_0371 [Pseudonocardia sp. Ae717_Ps2]